MKLEKLAAIYVIVLGIVALASALFPVLMSDFINVFSPVKADLSDSWAIRYRMSLFIAATILLLFFIPIIWRFGFYGADIEKFKTLSKWRYLIIIPMMPACWLWFLPLAFYQVCWTRYDIFYFFLTVGIFIALHLYIYSILLELTLFFRRNKLLQ
jgi:hypothetical protein